MHQPTDIQDRVTEPDSPGYGYGVHPGAYLISGFQSDSYNQHINERTALSCSPVWACKTYISQTIASLGWHVFERSGDGRSQKPIEDDVAWMLGMQANPEMNAFEWRQKMLMDALDGNAFSEIEFTASGRPTWLWRICPSRVTLLRDGLGRLLYEVSNDGAESTYLRPDQMFHLRSPGPDGLVGYSMVELFRRSIRLALNTERYGDAYFNQGPMPGGLLEMPATLAKDKRDEARDGFQKAYGGSANAGRIVVLFGGMKFTPTQRVSNEEAQLSVSRDANAYEIARIYRVPPHKIGLLARATWANIEAQAIEAIQDCLLPWARRLEMEADVKLYGRTNRGRRYTEINFATLLRGDSVAQAQAMQAKVNAGLMTPNEGRALLGLDPKEGGDVLLVQGAMTTLDRIINPPEPPPPAVQPGGGGTTNGGDAPPGKQPADQGDAAGVSEEVAAAFRDLFADAYGRQLKVEADKARRAERHGQLTAFVADFYDAALELRVAASITPVLAGLLAASGCGQERTASLAARLARDHAEASKAGVLAGQVGGWEARPAQQAGRHLALVLEAIK